MIDNQPSASRPRSPRPSARRQPAPRRELIARRDFAEGARWKVQLELAPAEIALVYRQGLARGAEVCRRGTHEWRPLVTTPELRAALEGRSSSPELDALGDGAALTLTQTLAIADPGLAKLLFAPRAAQALPSFAAPPPPPVITIHHTPLPEPRARPRIDSIPDSAVTQPLPARIPTAPESEIPAASFTPVATHARPAELSLVAALSIAVTLAAALFVQRAVHWGEVRAKIEEVPRNAKPRVPAASFVSPASLAPIATVASGIRVVPVHDLPLERAAVSGAIATSMPRAASPGSVNRGELARAMASAARSAMNCGSGPVRTQIVATFAPSGVPRAVQFGASPPPRALRSCMLSAVARTRVSPFVGEPVTVSKSLSW